MKNQILSVDNTQNSKRKSSNNIEINKIVVFFSVILIIISICFVSMGTYELAQNNGFYFGKPKATMERQNDELLIIANSKAEIDKIVYNWNNENEKTIEGEGRTELEETIELPVGNNTIKLTIYDINGKTNTYEESYEVESKAPQIGLEPENGKLKITAKDNSKMAYITYRWDEEQENVVNAEEESSAQIEKIIEIPAGQHTLTVVAVNSENLTTTKTQDVKGVRKPVVTVVQDSEDLSKLIISASDDEAIKKLEFVLNGKKYAMDLSKYHKQSIQYKQTMTQGENHIIVTATNFNDAQATFEGTCTYTP